MVGSMEELIDVTELMVRFEAPPTRGLAMITDSGAFKGLTLDLCEEIGLDVLVPDDAGRALVHRVIYEELVRGVVRPASREAYRRVIAELVAHGAQAIILGCTELPMLVKEEDATVPLFDTTTLHAMAAVDLALA